MSISANWVQILVLVFSGLLNLIGFFGLFLVFFPGLTIAWIGQLIWVIFVGFNHSHRPWQFGVTIGIFVLNTLIMLVGSVLDNILGASKAREKGVPWWEIGLSWLGMIVGGIFLTPIGGLGIALLLLYLTEYFRMEKDAKRALEGTKSMAFGFGAAAIIRLALCLVMIVLWVGMVVFL